MVAGAGNQDHGFGHAKSERSVSSPGGSEVGDWTGLEWRLIWAGDANAGAVSFVGSVSGLTLTSIGIKCSLILTIGSTWCL